MSLYNKSFKRVFVARRSHKCYAATGYALRDMRYAASYEATRAIHLSALLDDVGTLSFSL